MRFFKLDPKRERLPAAYLVLATYIALLASRFVDATLLDRENEYVIVVVLELVIFALPAGIFLKLRGGLTPARLRLTLPRVSHILLILSATLALISGGLLLGILFGGIGTMEGSFRLYDTFISKNNGGVSGAIYLITAYAALPALCEEFIFRGILCAEYERGGVIRAVAVSSFFFGLLHFDLLLLPSYIFSGVVLALSMYASQSISTAVIAHFLYNIFGLFLQPYVTAFYQTTGSTALFIIILTALFILSVAVFCGQSGRLYRRHALANTTPPYPTGQSARDVLHAFRNALLSPSFIMCIIVFVITIILF